MKSLEELIEKLYWKRYIFHCIKCHHEWESADEDNICDWCGSKGKIMEEQ